MNVPQPQEFPITSPQSQWEEALFSPDGTYVHPTALIGPHVTLEKNVKIGPYCVLIGNVTIKEGATLVSHVTVGMPAQHVDTRRSIGSIVIGRYTTVREFVTIHGAKEDEQGQTMIGDHCYIMNFSHIAHDATLGNHVVLTNGTNLAGHVHIGDHAVLMANTALHQWCRVGRFTCLTPFSGARQDLPPFSMFTGQPGHFSDLNRIALKRANIETASIDALKEVTKRFYRDRLMLDDIVAQAQESSWGNDPYVQEFIEFIRSSERGVSRRSRGYGRTLYY